MMNRLLKDAGKLSSKKLSSRFLARTKPTITQTIAMSKLPRKTVCQSVKSRMSTNRHVKSVVSKNVITRPNELFSNGPAGSPECRNVYIGKSMNRKMIDGMDIASAILITDGDTDSKYTSSRIMIADSAMLSSAVTRCRPIAINSEANGVLR